MWKLLRLAVNGLVFGFAVYAFCFLPIGDRTALARAKELLGSESAKTAADQVVRAAKKFDQKVRGGDGEALKRTATELVGAAGAPEILKSPDIDDIADKTVSHDDGYQEPEPGSPLQRRAPR